MGKIIFTLFYILVDSVVFAQTITRLDDSKISANELDKKINQLMKDASVTGMAVCIFNDGKAVYNKVFGYKSTETKAPLQLNTNFYGASLSKAVFAVLVMKLVEEKIISLDKPLQDYLPQPVYDYGKGSSWNEDFTSLKDEPLYKKITARHCLSHSSGFANWRWYETDQQLHVHFEPGSQYSYSGEGLCYLQFVIEKITGKKLNELMTEKLFGPAGMKNSSYTWQPAYEANYCFGHDKTGLTRRIKTMHPDLPARWRQPRRIMHCLPQRCSKRKF
jgi:CubicO group peptidase (beta-lactamase class C family)